MANDRVRSAEGRENWNMMAGSSRRRPKTEDEKRQYRAMYYRRKLSMETKEDREIREQKQKEAMKKYIERKRAER
jgi:hypothetical protein